MKIKYCRKYDKYVSQQHCEFFNEGDGCEYFSAHRWNSIKDLLQDEDRPRWDVDEVIKPYRCNLLGKELSSSASRRRRMERRYSHPLI